MRIAKLPCVLAVLTMGAPAGTCLAQQRVFEWQPANDESVRLDPGNYHTGRTYHPGPNGGGIHVDIRSQKPVTIFMTRAGDWDDAVRHPAALARLPRMCVREHVLDTTYVCQLPPEAMTLIVRDDRNNPDAAVFAGLGAVLNPRDKVDRAVGVGIATVMTGSGSVPRHFVSPNDVHIQYYRWACVENCIQPEIRWMRQFKEKYKLTSLVKVYGGFAPGYDGERVSIRIKSPVPMIVAMLPSEVANQLHARPELLETALEKNSCQQRAVESLEFQCTFELADGPQALVVAPEQRDRVPHKKAQIEMYAAKCVANCALPPQQP